MNITMGEDDSFELDALDDLYAQHEFSLSDVFSVDLPPIEDTPAASAAFSSFVNELETVTAQLPPFPHEMAQKTIIAGNEASEYATPIAASGETTQERQQWRTTNNRMPYEIANAEKMKLEPDSLLGPTAQLLAAHAGRDAEYPDVLDAIGLGAHAVPMNIAADAQLVGIEIARSAPSCALASMVPDADALARHLAPSAATGTRPLTAGTRGPVLTAAARGRPRVREMRHPDGGVNSGTAGAAGAKLRYSKGAAPSKYCHVCGRSAKTVSVALCGNNRLGLCRKVVCDKCLLMHQRDSWDVAKTPGSNWICMHCRARCPERARCHQYQRNNLKRRMRGALSPPQPSSSPRRVAPMHSGIREASRVAKPPRSIARRALRNAGAEAAARDLVVAATAAGSEFSGAGMMQPAITTSITEDSMDSSGLVQQALYSVPDVMTGMDDNEAHSQDEIDVLNNDDDEENHLTTSGDNNQTRILLNGVENLGRVDENCVSQTALSTTSDMNYMSEHHSRDESVRAGAEYAEEFSPASEARNDVNGDMHGMKGEIKREEESHKANA